MKRSRVAVVAFILFQALFLVRTQFAAAAEATIYRDEFGIPHVFAPNLESAAYAVGYAQAEDRLEELLKNYRRANGAMAEVFGPDYFKPDLIQRMWRHAEVSRDKYQQVSPKMRAVMEAYQQGVHQFMKEHPEQVLSWAQEISSLGYRRAWTLYHLGLAFGRGGQRFGKGRHSRRPNGVSGFQRSPAWPQTHGDKGADRHCRSAFELVWGISILSGEGLRGRL